MERRADPTAAHAARLLREHYGGCLAGVVLYGSEARGDARPDSDLDLLVLLEEPFDYFAELRRIVDLLYPLQLEAGRLISARPAGADEYARGAIQLYRNARREGALLHG